MKPVLLCALPPPQKKIRHTAFSKLTGKLQLRPGMHAPVSLCWPSVGPRCLNCTTGLHIHATRMQERETEDSIPLLRAVWG